MAKLDLSSLIVKIKTLCAEKTLPLCMAAGSDRRSEMNFTVLDALQTSYWWKNTDR